MRLPTLDVVTGEVIRVRLSLDQPAPPKGRRRRRRTFGARSYLNRMEVTLRDEDGKERELVFVNATVGVREGHRLSVVRADAPDTRAPMTILLHNHATGQRQEMAAALARVVSQRAIPATWRALGASVVVFGAFWLAQAAFAESGGDLAAAAIAAVLSFPALLFVFAAIDRTLTPRLEARLAERLRAEMEGRLRAAEPAPAPR